MIWNKPALFEANVFTDLLFLKALFAAEDQSADLHDWENWLKKLHLFPQLGRQILEWPLTLAVIRFYLLKQTELPVIWEHVVSAVTEVETAAAQARGLWEFNNRQKYDLLESLTASTAIPTIILVSDKDRLVAQEPLHDILGVAQEMVGFITSVDPHMTFSCGRSVDVNQLGLSVAPGLFVLVKGDHYSYKPRLIADFVKLCRHLEKYYQVVRGERNTFGVARGYLDRDPWNLLVRQLIGKLPFRQEMQDLKKWNGFWPEAIKFNDQLVSSVTQSWHGAGSYVDVKDSSKFLNLGYKALLNNSTVLGLALRAFADQLYQAGYFLLSREEDNDKKP